MAHKDIDLNILESNHAVAVSSAPRNSFSMVNEVFSTMFGDIATPEQLHGIIASKSETKTVIAYGDGHWELLEFSIIQGQTLHLLKNISYEMLILRKLKEQLKTLAGTNHLYSEILDKDLPIGLMVIDGDYNVSFANQALKRMFSLPPKAKLKKCYNYVRELRVCDNCIIEPLKAGKKASKKTFTGKDNDNFLTAEAHYLEDKYIITFRDTTREIKLIRQIKEQQETLEKANRMIAEQNDILKRLSNINIRMGRLKDLDKVLELVIDSIIDTFESPRGAIILFNKARLIESANFSEGIGQEERDIILRNVGDPDKSFGEGLADFINMDIGDKENTIGEVFLYKPAKGLDSSTIGLFLMQVNIFVMNLKLQQRLEEIAQTDSLTGVFNRYYFDKQLEKEKEQSVKFGQPLSLIIVDVNGLKQANDNIGHEAGDGLIKGTADIIGANIGEFDTVYRVGGDEYVVLLPNCPEKRLKEMLLHLKQVQEDAAIECKGHRLEIRFSLGGACSVETEHGQLKDRADKRMYADKEEYYKTHKRYR